MREINHTIGIRRVCTDGDKIVDGSVNTIGTISCLLCKFNCSIKVHTRKNRDNFITTSCMIDENNDNLYKDSNNDKFHFYKDSNNDKFHFVYTNLLLIEKYNNKFLY